MIERNEQKLTDTWDLSGLVKDGNEWEKGMKKLKKAFKKAPSFKGTLTSSTALLAALQYYKSTSMLAERLGNWAYLMYESDSTDSENMRRLGLYQAEAAAFSESFSYFTPELLSIDEEKLRDWMKAPEYKEYRVFLNKTLRTKSHVLEEKEERLMSLFLPVSGSAEKAFMDLNNADLDFGDIDGEKLTHGTYPVFIRSKDESIRERAYRQYYSGYDAHKHTIADLYASSVQEDIFTAKARGFKTSLEAALFPDKIPSKVYTSLISAVHDAFPVLHEYYRVKARVLGKEKLHHWDCYMPMAEAVSNHHTYDEAVDIISEAVRPLGEDYRATLISGLTTERWVDKYENKGKRSGAFSAGGYSGNPYILTNFEENVLDSVFTLIHEGGHSMHTWYSVRSNPYMCYDYSIFEAETASTFNENLLTHYFLTHAATKEEEAYIIGKNLDDIVATLFRQTMFAEYELIIHTLAEKKMPITLETLRSEYRKLLEAYFGPDMIFEDVSDLEGLRVPHFYRAFYCYKYATGISASIALSERVINGGEKERNDYLSFLCSGGSRYPLQSLKKAGVDMSTPEPVKAAAKHFSTLLARFKAIKGLN
ncbi:MAG: oligoendopeptidase F [Spirochaetes bacterium]|uniref:Oligopeptidase F n=1 Tax=Candidatus Ornithospirochaeta stercoripullorum TaxID=2840899 RepID=A0A9D9E135_9SPIO|nr:oligoendopeptidase F [Candidatus Ornithospirochaeta stercoripullorum]